MNTKIKKEEFLVILLNIIIFFIFFMNSFISLVLNIAVIIFSKIKSKYSFYLLTLNLAVINLFRIPHSDYYRYFIRYYDMQNLPLEVFKEQLSRRVDYIFYISKYIFSTNGYSFFSWAFCYSLIVYIFVYLISNKINPKNRVYIYLLVNPFNITRFNSAMVIASYGILTIVKYKKYFYIALSWLTHKFFLISYLILLTQKIKVKFKKKSVIILGIVILLISFLFRNHLIKFIGAYITISEKYYDLNFEKSEFNLYFLRKYLFLILDIIILFILFLDEKKVIIRLNIIVMVMISCISKVVFGRYLTFIVFLGSILFFKEYIFRNLRKFLIAVIIIKYFIIFTDNIRYGYKTNTYPFKQEILKKDQVMDYLDQNGSIRY